jgi:hypothetical protein
MTTSFIKMACTGYVSISWARFLERESANLALLLFLVKLTPAMPNLVEKRRRNQLWPYLWLGKTSLHVFLVDFGSLRPSGAIGGHLQVILLQGSFQGHQGHFSVGAVGG